MPTDILIEIAVTALVLTALVITCAVLSDVHPPRGRHK